MEDYLAKVEKIANEIEDGHYTLLRFTTNYRGYFGTFGGDYIAQMEFFQTLPAHKTMNNLLKGMARSPEKYRIPRGDFEELYDSLAEEDGSNLCMGAVYMGDGMYLTSEGEFVSEEDL